jgi:tetratricopeptide (TPR) repeat protein
VGSVAELSEPGTLYRLSLLEERWRSDRSPHVFLQLADELRRAGRGGRAVEVLREGLAGHPESVSGWVVLGRLLLDEADAAGAIEALERALERDPAQLVASRLLTEAWIRVGDAEKAGESLERSRLLSLPDGDYEALAAQVRALSGEPGAAAGRPALASAGRPFELSPPDPLPEIDLQRIGPGRRGWVRVAVDSEPFTTLLTTTPGSPAGVERRLRAGGVFDLPAATVEAATTAPPGPAPADAAALEAAAAPPALEPDRGAETVVAAGEAAEEREPPATEPFAEPIFEPQTIGEEVERETREESTAAPTEAPPAFEPPAASSTLAALYLAQGHLDEAEAEYRQVLGDRPDDAEALAGLRDVRERRSVAPSPPAGLTARKLRRLRGFYEGLRDRRRAGRSGVS